MDSCVHLLDVAEKSSLGPANAPLPVDLVVDCSIVEWKFVAIAIDSPPLILDSCKEKTWYERDDLLLVCYVLHRSIIITVVNLLLLKLVLLLLNRRGHGAVSTRG